MAEKKNPNYIKHGSAEHAALLGLKKAGKDDTLQLDGWTLEDMTQFGPQATELYVREVLRQKVSELKAGQPKVPANAKPLWRPRDLPDVGSPLPPGVEIADPNG
jgi:hypothetical protein